GRPPRTLSPPSKAILSNCFCNLTRCSTSTPSTRLRRSISDSTSMDERFGFGIVSSKRNYVSLLRFLCPRNANFQRNPTVCNALPYGVLDVYDLTVIIRPGKRGVGYNVRHLHQLLEERPCSGPDVIDIS